MDHAGYHRPFPPPPVSIEMDHADYHRPLPPPPVADTAVRTTQTTATTVVTTTATPATTPSSNKPSVPLKKPPLRKENGSANFSEYERINILIAIHIARTVFGWSEAQLVKKGFGESFCDKVRSVLSGPDFAGKITVVTKVGDGKSPADSTIKRIFTTFARDHRAGVVRKEISGKKKELDKRQRILEVLESGDMSARQVATLSGTSPSLVARVLKETKRSLRKR